MEAAQLIPDVLDKEPKSVLKVSFGQNDVHLGNKLSIQQVSQEPIVTWTGEPDKFYTLCFTDPDAPSRATPTVREWVHWLVVNIPGSSCDPSQGETLAQFVPSCPGQDSGTHRYTFVLHQQPATSPLDFSSFHKLDKSLEHRALRRHFSIRTFAKTFALGDALAANFFTTEWDEYVTVIKKELGLP